MGEKYAECLKTHGHLNGKTDGCQEFWSDKGELECKVCRCHRNFHRKVEAPVVVYTKCHKVHTFGSQASVDGCQEFKPFDYNSTKCALCLCDKGYHRNLLTT